MCSFGSECEWIRCEYFYVVVFMCGGVYVTCEGVDVVGVCVMC